MIEVENTDVNIVRNLIPMRNHMPASAYGLKAISDWLCLQHIFGNTKLEKSKAEPQKFGKLASSDIVRRIETQHSRFRKKKKDLCHHPLLRNFHQFL